MALSQGLKLLHSDIYREMFKKILLKKCCTKWDNIEHGAFLGQGNSNVFK